MKTPDTFSGTRCMGGLYATETAAAVADLHGFLSADGYNSEEEVIASLIATDARASILAEMAENRWVTHELVVSDFERIRDRLLEQIQDGE